LQEVFDPRHLPHEALAGGGGRDDQEASSLQEPLPDRLRLDREEGLGPSQKKALQLGREVEGLDGHRVRPPVSAGISSNFVRSAVEPIEGQEAEDVVEVPPLEEDPGHVDLRRPAEVSEVGLPLELLQGAPLADQAALVPDGLVVQGGEPPLLREAMLTDRYLPVRDLKRVEKLDELRLQGGVAPGDVGLPRLPEEPDQVFGLEVPLVPVLVYEKLLGAGALRSILEAELPLEEGFTAPEGEDEDSGLICPRQNLDRHLDPIRRR